MAHMGVKAFDTIGGEVVSTTAFVFEHSNAPERQGVYLRLVEGKNESEKAQILRSSISNNGNSSSSNYIKQPQMILIEFLEVL